MGGLGSGRPSGSGRSTVESWRLIDINKLQREGCLKPGWAGAWQWKSDGQHTAWVNLKAEADHIRLSYRVRIAGGEWQEVDEPVRFIREPCRFGGTRAYFICPGIVNGAVCSRRVVKLHGAGRYFLCRRCYRLAYASQREDTLDRSYRRARKIRHRLGGDANMLVCFPDKPKGMWTKTYERLRAKALQAEVQAERMFEIKAEALLGRIQRIENKGSFW